MGTTKRSSFASYEIALERATARLGVIAQTRGPLGFAAAWLLASGARALFPREGLLAWGLLAFPVMMTVVSLGWALVRRTRRTWFDLEGRRVRCGRQWFGFAEVTLSSTSREGVDAINSAAVSGAHDPNDELATTLPYREFSITLHTPKGPRSLMHFRSVGGSIDALTEALTLVLEGRQADGLAKLELAVQEPPRPHQIAETQQGMALVLFGIYGLLAPLWW